jgi:hypothetical protein
MTAQPHLSTPGTPPTCWKAGRASRHRLPLNKRLRRRTIGFYVAPQ